MLLVLVVSFPASSAARSDSNAASDEGLYYFRGKPVRLLRSPDDMSVRFEGPSKAKGSRLVRGLSRSARLSLASGARGHDLYELTGAPGGLISSLEAQRTVEFAYPAWLTPSGGKVLLNDEIIVQIHGSALEATVRRALADRGLAIVRRISYSSRQYLLRLLEPKKTDPLAMSRLLYRSGLVEWAEPNFVQELQKSYIPDDPLFPEEWQLQNTGQGGGEVGADASVAAAWDIETGDPEITIAIIDDGVETRHPDLAENIFTNRREKPDNRIDDDGNGLIDDIHGWNFATGEPDANPGGAFLESDDHGTAVAGVAAARGGNGGGVSGACPRCTILPVKINSAGFWADDATIADAIRYAGQMADLLNISWGGTLPSASLQYALGYVLATGRNGKGALVFAASGNLASGNATLRVSDMPPGTYRFRWIYLKNERDLFDIGADSAWLAWVRFPGEELQNFESGEGLPAGWSSGGSGGVPWTVVNDPSHSDEGLCWSRAARSGKISNAQETYIETVRTTTVPGDLDFLSFISSEAGEYPAVNGSSMSGGLDGLRLMIDRGNDGSFDWSSGEVISGVPPASVVYPAFYRQAVAVGATTNFGCRAAYSQYGPELDLVAPSSGGSTMAQGIPTTDRTGSAGYDEGDYFLDFGGTSSATPLAAGVAGLVLSRNPGLTAEQVREIMQSSADKVSPDTAAYDATGHSDRVGYGRVNALRALQATPEPAMISLSAPRRVREGQSVKILVKRGGNVSMAVSVGLSDRGASAWAPSDFAAVSRRLNFKPGERVKKISIATNKDMRREPTERFSVRLGLPSNGALLTGPSAARLDILDATPRLGRIGSASVSRAVFGLGEADSVSVNYGFSRPSGSWRYELSRRQERGWTLVRSVRRRGSFRGLHRLGLRPLFGARPIVRGEYRLRIYADTNSRLLTFRVS